MSSIRKKLIPELITPFNFKAMVDLDALSDLVDFYLAAGAKGFFVNTFSSEMYSINEKERLQLARQTVDVVKNRVPVYSTGSFGLTLADKAEFTKKIFDTGVRAVLLVSSHYANVDASDGQLLKNFETMFGLTGNIPFGIYEGPAPYKRVVSRDVFQSLLSTGRVVNIIDGSEDTSKIGEKVEVALQRSNVEVFESFTPNMVSSLRQGTSGISVTAGIFFPELLVWLCENATNPEKESEVSWLQEELNKIHPQLNTAYPLNVKYFLRKRGLNLNTISRAHSFELTPQQKQSMDVIYSAYFSWCQRLNIQLVDVKELRVPKNYPLDPAV